MNGCSAWAQRLVDEALNAGLDARAVDGEILPTWRISSGRRKVGDLVFTRVRDGHFSATLQAPSGDGIVVSRGRVPDDARAEADLDEIAAYLRAVAVLDGRMPLEEFPTDVSLRAWRDAVVGLDGAEAFASIVAACREAGEGAPGDALLLLHGDASITEPGSHADDRKAAVLTRSIAEHRIAVAARLRKDGSYSASWGRSVEPWEPKEPRRPLDEVRGMPSSFAP